MYDIVHMIWTMGDIGFSYNLETELKSLFFLHLTKVPRFVVVQQNKQFNKTTGCNLKFKLRLQIKEFSYFTSLTK